MKVLLVDDNALFLEALRNMLEANDIEVVGEAFSAREALEKAAALTPEIVLMDVQMPGQSGIEATRALKARFPMMKVVMMTVSESDDHLFDALTAGACGYLIKGMHQVGFLESLSGMVRGESPLSRRLASKVLAEFTRRAQEPKAVPATEEPAASLTERQMKILGHIAEGRTYKQTAGILGLSESTIKYHMGEITDRLHLENRAQVIAFAARMQREAKFR